MEIPADLKYTNTHEWARLEGNDTISVGITHHAQDLLGDLVYVEGPEPGRILTPGQECGVVESVKTASDIYAPLAGEVIANNSELQSAPEKINQDAYTNWIFKLKLTHASDWNSLLDAKAYQALIDSTH